MRTLLRLLTVATVSPACAFADEALDLITVRQLSREIATRALEACRADR